MDSTLLCTVRLLQKVVMCAFNFRNSQVMHYNSHSMKFYHSIQLSFHLLCANITITDFYHFGFRHIWPFSVCLSVRVCVRYAAFASVFQLAHYMRAITTASISLRLVSHIEIYSECLELVIRFVLAAITRMFLALEWYNCDGGFNNLSAVLECLLFLQPPFTHCQNKYENNLTLEL